MNTKPALLKFSIIPLFLVVLACLISPANAQVVKQMTDAKTSDTSLASLTDDGSLAYAISNADPCGTNPESLHQIFEFETATGDVRQATFFPEDISRIYPQSITGPDVSDDGGMLAFVSDGNLGGENPDGSQELFVINTDGTGLLQLTDTPSLNDGEFYWSELAGSGNRIVFSSNADYLGQNPDRFWAVYVIDTDGTGLAQLVTPTAGSFIPLVSISDNGERIAFSDSNMTVFAINVDGTDLHQLFIDGHLPYISGDGSTIVFLTEADLPSNPLLGMGGCDGTKAAAIDWDGSNLTKVSDPCLGAITGGLTQLPTLTDDGQVIFHTADCINSSYLASVWRVNRDGSDQTVLTDLASEPLPHAHCTFALASGSGSYTTYLCTGGEPFGGPNPDLGMELYAGTGQGTDHRQLTDTLKGDSLQPDLTPDGSQVVFVSNIDLLGDGAAPGSQVYRIAGDGSNLARLTDFTDRNPRYPSISDNGSVIVFAADEIWVVGSDGSGLAPITPGGSCYNPAISGDGGTVVFESQMDFTGENPENYSAIYKVLPDGSGLEQLTTLGERPRIDGSGTWISYRESKYYPPYFPDAPLHRIRSNGADNQVVGIGQRPDISADGTRIVFDSPEDPLGTNPEGNREIFLWDAGTGTTSQLTVTVSGDNTNPSISDDGAFAYFASTSTYFGEVFDSAFLDLFRVEVSTGVLERVGGLACYIPEESFHTYGGTYYLGNLHPIVAGGTGEKAVYTGGNCTGANPDYNMEIFLIDLTTPATIRVSPGVEPTVVSWDAESGPLRYDVIRGDLASLAEDGGAVDLGSVVCIENDSIDLNTIGYEDAEIPVSGQGFFYLYRGTPGDLAGPGTYGKGSSGLERLPADGDCGM